MQKLPSPSGHGHGLSDEQRRQLWTRVETSDPRAGAPDRRRAPRLPFNRTDVSVRVTHPGGGCTSRRVCTHDLSSGGLGFLHPGFLHIGTAVSVTLPRRLGGADIINGKVVCCLHAAGSWHAVGVRFDEPIFPKLYVDPAEWDRLPTVDAVKPEELSGRLILLDDQELERSLFAHMLRETQVQLTAVSTLEQARAEVAKGSVDVICVDLNLGIGQPSGEEAITALRSAGYAGPFVAISGDTSARLEQARTLGVGATLSKPYRAEQLWAVIAAATNATVADDEVHPLYSELANQPGISGLLQQFCEKVQDQLRDLQRVMASNDMASVRLFCTMLRGTASGYGYPSVSEAAADALRALDAGGDLTEAAAELQHLQVLCRRLFPGKKP